MSEHGSGLDLGFDFSGDDVDESGTQAVSSPSEMVPFPSAIGPPIPALREVQRASRHPSSAAAADVERLLVAAGLRRHAPVEIRVATTEGHWSEVPFDGGLIVGRSGRDADVLVDLPAVSRRHCRISRTSSGDAVVEDLASANGTWIDRGQRRLPVEPGHPVRLEHGDWIRSGPEAALVYVAVTDA